MLQMQDLMSKSMRDFKEGSIVKGRILEIRPREVLVDIGYKSEGVIPASEFDDIESLEVGDEVEVSARTPRKRRGHGRSLEGKSGLSPELEQDRRAFLRATD